MALIILKEDGSNETISFSFSSFEQAGKNNFLLSNEDGSGEKIRIEFPFPIAVIPTGYTVSVFTFKNQYYSQSDLIELRVREKKTQSGRVGYTFLLRALTDGENNIFDEHTLPFAYYAFLKLISTEGELIPKTPIRNTTGEYTLADFYDEDLVLAVLCDQLTQEIPEFSFDDYLYIFFIYGFVYVDSNEKEIEYNSISFIKDNFEKSLKNQQNFHNSRYSWKLSGAQKFLRDEAYPVILAKSLISEKHYFLSKFHILYQVVEILIGDILKNEIINTIKKVDDVSGFKLKESLNKLASEGSRIKLLLNGYSNISSGFGEQMIEKLKEFFNEIKINLPLDGDDIDDSNKLYSLLYKHRNNLVHNYRIIHKDTSRLGFYLTLLKEINLFFEYLVFEVLHTYKIVQPVASPPETITPPESLIPQLPADIPAPQSPAARRRRIALPVQPPPDSSISSPPDLIPPTSEPI